MATSGLIASMRWLCFYPRCLALDALGLEDAAGVVVTARLASRRWVVATRESVFPGADVNAILAVRPELRCIDADPKAEATAVEQLAALAHGLGGPVHVEHRRPCPDYPAGYAAVWVEVGRSEQLFGGRAAVLAAARQRLQEQHLACGVAIAPTLEGAWLAAQLEDGAILTSADDLHAWLDRVPVGHLPLPASVRDGLRASGVGRCGALMSLPTDQLSRRFSAATTHYLDRLAGRAEDPRLPHRLPRCFEQGLRFDSSVHYVEGLGFPMRRLLGALSLYLRARDAGTRQIRLKLEHEDTPVTTLGITLSAPARDADYWLLMTRERLARLKLPAPVVAIRLACDAFSPMEAPQLDLFDTGRAQADAWRQTVERLIARLGVEAVWGMGLAADHRPECAWQRLPLQARAADAASAPPLERPDWLFDPPRPMTEPPQVSGEPERIESGWWEGRDSRRDYYITRTVQGARLWVYQDRNDQHWYLHGLWA